MKEAEFTSITCRAFEKLNAVIIPIVQGKESKPGVPDRFIAHTYWQGFIEFKGHATKIRPIQSIVLRELKKRGVNAFVVRAGMDEQAILPSIEDENGVWIADFENTKDLLNKLVELSK